MPVLMSFKDALPKPEVHFDPGGKCYYMQNERGNFIAVSEGNLKISLKRLGYCGDTPRDKFLSEVDEIMDDIRKHSDVEYAGPLAGYKTGSYVIENRRVLVTESPRFIEPSDEGDFVVLRQLLTNLLGEEQLPYFYSWLKVGITALRAGKRRPGQVLVMAGPAGCGKSLVQNLVTKMLGGRSAKPFQYMTGGTQFNSELFHAEHLMIEDEVASFDLRTRRTLGSNLKAFVVNESQRCHPKNRQALTLLPFWRLSMTLNDEPESLMVMPLLDESVGSKMMIFRAFMHAMPMPTETLEQWGAFMQVIEAELPRLLNFVIKVWQIPDAMKDARYGVAHYHHPEILEMMNVLAPEMKLLELMDLELWKDSADPSALEMKAAELEVKLCAPGSKVAHEARKLALYNTAFGQYLARLERLRPERVASRICEGIRLYLIEPPPPTPTTQ
jgi:hypothetical protein